LSLFALTSSFAQLKTQRRVTGLQLGAAAEGSRVTVLADAPLNDYEAFRRGDRFYVKIPLADFMTAWPHFRADGFESVQVQKAGDSLIVSFKLQPGATARVNQYGNRLDVVFSAPIRSSYNLPAISGSTSTSGTPGTARQTSSERGSGAAGPMAPVGSSTSDSSGSTDQGGSTYNPRFGNSRRRSGNNSTAGPNAAVAAGSPIPSPSTAFSPTPYSNYPPLTTATPALSSQIAVASRSGSSNWENRRGAVMRWMSANRLATLLGALILLSLILYLAAAVRRRKKNAGQAAGARAKVQPKYSPNEELDELRGTRTKEELWHQQSAGEQPAALASTEASAQDRPLLTKPTIVSPTAARDEHKEHNTVRDEREFVEL
jgi:hypothetical protein